MISGSMPVHRSFGWGLMSLATVNRQEIDLFTARIISYPLRLYYS